MGKVKIAYLNIIHEQHRPQWKQLFFKLNTSHKSKHREWDIYIINNSTYYNDAYFRDVLKKKPTKSELRILNLNCLNLNTRFDLLKLFLLEVDINSHINCITLQGTCFNENTDLTFYKIPGYSLISNPCRLSTHCGVAIYLHEKVFIWKKICRHFLDRFWEPNYWNMSK